MERERLRLASLQFIIIFDPRDCLLIGAVQKSDFSLRVATTVQGLNLDCASMIKGQSNGSRSLAAPLPRTH